MSFGFAEEGKLPPDELVSDANTQALTRVERTLHSIEHYSPFFALPRRTVAERKAASSPNPYLVVHQKRNHGRPASHERK